MLPCGHPKANPNTACHICVLYSRDDRYRRLHDGLPQQNQERRRTRRPCVSLGGLTRQTRDCHSCAGHVRIKLNHCDLHGTCSPTKQLPGVPWCLTCPDYEPTPRPFPEPGPVRNLLFHLYPVKGNGRWQWNVRQLLHRINLFNGHRAVAIATDHRTAPVEQVKRAFGGHVEDFITLTNDPGLREVASFNELFHRVANDDPRQATLYAHGKSVTQNNRGTSNDWAELLHEVNCDYWPLVEEALTHHPVTGAFRMSGRFWPEHSNSTWAYSGSWYWIRNADHFSRPGWDRIDRFWTGIEPYPSLHFSWQEAHCLFLDQCGNMYDGRYLNTVVKPAYEKWSVENADQRTGSCTSRHSPGYAPSLTSSDPANVSSNSAAVT